MKNWICFLLIIITSSWLFGCSPAESSPNAGNVISNPTKDKTFSAEELYSMVTEDDISYYISDSKIMKMTENASHQILLQEENTVFSDLMLEQGALYFVANKTDHEDFEIRRISLDKKECITVLKKNDFVALSNDLFTETDGIDATIYDHAIYFKFSIELFRLNLDTFEVEKLLDDVEDFQISGNNLYYRDHAEQTFSIYKLDLQTKEKHLLLGDGLSAIDDKKNQTLYQYICLSDDTLYYCRNNPSGLYMYADKTETIIVDDTNIHWDTLSSYENKLYYLSGTNLQQYDIKTMQITTVASLSNYSYFVGIRNHAFFYYDENYTLHSFNLP